MTRLCPKRGSRSNASGAFPSALNLSQKGRQVLGAVLRADEDQVGQKVIGDPEYGWRSLLVRLSGDLERTGTILPQRLKIVLYGTITAASVRRGGTFSPQGPASSY